MEEPVADKSPPSSTKEKVPQLDTQDMPSTGRPDDAAAEGAKEDWEDERAVEDAAMQTLVERLHEKGEKEVSRVLKVRQMPGLAKLIKQAIEYDKRLAVSFPRLDINPDIRQRILDLALDDDAVGEGQVVRSIKGTASPVDRDKALIRLFVTLQVLQRLGFSDERIEESVMKGVGDGEGWEKAIEWVGRRTCYYDSKLTVSSGCIFQRMNVSSRTNSQRTGLNRKVVQKHRCRSWTRCRSKLLLQDRTIREGMSE